MKRDWTLVQHAGCVLAVAACAVALQGCDAEPYHPYNAAAEVPVSPQTAPYAARLAAVRSAAAERPVVKVAVRPVQKAAPAPARTAPVLALSGSKTTAAPLKAASAKTVIAAKITTRRLAAAGRQTAVARLAAEQSRTPQSDYPMHASAPHRFGKLEAAAVRYAGGPCSADIYRMAWAAADMLQIHPAFVAAVIEIESRCRNKAVSGAGARGLMQLVPAYGAREGYRFMYGTDRKPTLAELRNPATNIQLGVAYLGALQDHFYYVESPMTRLVLVIAAYNCGPDFIDQRLPPEARGWDTEKALRWIHSSAPQETRLYVDAVMEKAALYSSATMTAGNETAASTVVSAVP